jgi:hypothetical protein
MNNKSLCAAFLASLLLTGGVSAAPEFLYFAPGRFTSPDGRITLAAFKEGEEGSLFYVSGKGDKLEIVSDAVFGAFESHPDVRGYGPTMTWFSLRDKEGEPDHESYPHIVGEMVLTMAEGRRSSTLAIHTQKLVKGKTKLVAAPFELDELAQVGRKDLDKKLKAAGLLPGPEESLYHQGGSMQVMTKEGDEFVASEMETFELADGVHIQVAEVFGLRNKKGDDIMASFSVLFHVTRAADGEVSAKVVKIESSIDE